MKKKLIIAGLCIILLSMPTMTALQTYHKTKDIQTPEINDIKISEIENYVPPIDDYDGTFAGGLGNLFKENGEWQFEASALLYGVYKLGVHKKLYGGIYTLEEEQIGTIFAFFGNRIIIGFIANMQNQRAPIIGFLIYNDENFLGRIMSVAGPAPYIAGEYTPNNT